MYFHIKLKLGLYRVFLDSTERSIPNDAVFPRPASYRIHVESFKVQGFLSQETLQQPVWRSRLMITCLVAAARRPV